MIDSRYRSKRPLIVTTNLTLEGDLSPEDTAHARIYDRLVRNVFPVAPEQLRSATRRKMEQLKKAVNRKEPPMTMYPKE